MNPALEEDLIQAQDAFVWEAPAFERHERSTRWYGVMALVALVLVAYAIWTANFLFAFLILLAAIMLVLAGNEASPPVLIQIGDNGVVWDGEFIPYEQIRHFAIIYQPPEVKVLYIQPRNLMRPRLRIDLGGQDPVDLRNHLKQYAFEDLKLQEEHASDTFARLFRL
jgi:hypothetical protein